jgi:hypothetical protein
MAGLTYPSNEQGGSVRAWQGIGVTILTATVGVMGLDGAAGASTGTFLQQLTAISKIGSTVPANGDVNPYGVAAVTTTSGKLVAGDTLVSNFNSKVNVQGTGSTIVELAPNGAQQLFAHISQLPAGNTCPGGIGLTTALDILPGGWVVVGSMPTSGGGALPTGSPAGCLIVLNNAGTVVETFTNPNIDGPWDMTDQLTATGANLYVSNALGGNTKTSKGVPVAGECTVVRLTLAFSGSAMPSLTSSTVIGNNFPWKANAASFVLAPTGLALAVNGTLLVDNSLTNSVSAIPQAPTRTTAVSAHAGQITKGGGLNAPLGMVTLPNDDVLVVNGNNGKATEITLAGKQVTVKTLIKGGAGDLFGLILSPNRQGIVFVNDGANSLELAQPRSAG